MNLKEILTKNNAITEEAYNNIEEMSEQLHSSVEDIIIGKNFLTKENYGAIIAKYYNTEYINLDNLQINSDIIRLIPKEIALKYKAISFSKTSSDLKVGMTDPANVEAIEFIKKATGYNIIPYFVTESDFHNALRFYKTEIKQEFKDIIQKNIQESKKGTKTDETALPIIKIVDTIVEYAISEGASDIHVESLETGALVRYRVDGILHDAVDLPKEVLHPIIARIKILSNLKIDEHRLPQDGRFKIRLNDQDVSFRVSIIPTYFGEKIVMRILEDSAKNYSLNNLGLNDKDKDIVASNIRKPNGMILVTGPTGSGKSTTLYTVLGILNTPEVNINTVEDPIEYSMPRVNQMQVSPTIGLTFSSGLRAFLRQDPNIIMVGEIRDTETADIAINAAMTGHLVLSTLHTNDSLGAIPRLIDMHIEPYLIATTVNLVMGQRLVRKLCEHCKKQTEPSKQIRDNLIKSMDNNQALTDKLRDDIQTKPFFSAEGCNYCTNGYKGRIGIYEVCEITPTLRQMILEKRSANDLKLQAFKEGLTLMMQDGLDKALSGITTIEEVLRVTKE